MMEVEGRFECASPFPDSNKLMSQHTKSEVYSEEMIFSGRRSSTQCLK